MAAVLPALVIVGILLLGWQMAGLRSAPSPASPIVRTLATGATISSAPVAADIDGDTWPEIIVASDAVHVFALDGHELPGWPQAGANFFASTPVVADLDGDGAPEIVAGSDDDRVYAWHADGTPVAGWPVVTGNDVFSTPAVWDLDQDGRREVVVGSDDGYVYVLTADGRPFPGWPVRTGGFVSASPALSDLDGDGAPEILIGSWDHRLYALRTDGTPVPGWPVDAGAPVWAKAAVIHTEQGAGHTDRVFLPTDRLSSWAPDGTPQDPLSTAWPRQLRSYTVGGAVAAELDGTPGLEIVIGGDAVWAFDPDGSLVAGWPHRTGAYVWAAPVAVDLDGDGLDEVIVGDFAGRLHLIGPGGREGLAGWPLQLPERIVASVSLVDTPDGGRLIAVAGWDRAVHLVRAVPFRGWFAPEPALAELPQEPPLSIRSWSLLPRSGLPVRTVVAELSVAPVRSFTLTYLDRAGGVHPSPFLLNGTRYEALIAPVGADSVQVVLEAVAWDGSRVRVPERGTLLLPCPDGC